VADVDNGQIVLQFSNTLYDSTEEEPQRDHDGGANGAMDYARASGSQKPVPISPMSKNAAEYLSSVGGRDGYGTQLYSNLSAVGGAPPSGTDLASGLSPLTAMNLDLPNIDFSGSNGVTMLPDTTGVDRLANRKQDASSSRTAAHKSSRTTQEAVHRSGEGAGATGTEGFAGFSRELTRQRADTKDDNKNAAQPRKEAAYTSLTADQQAYEQEQRLVAARVAADVAPAAVLSWVERGWALPQVDSYKANILEQYLAAQPFAGDHEIPPSPRSEPVRTVFLLSRRVVSCSTDLDSNLHQHRKGIE
jgi:hypothetical protein